MQDCTTETATLGRLGTQQLASLAQAVGLTERTRELTRLFEVLLGPEGQTSRTTTRWRSDVCDDHTPYEFSVAMGPQHAELRVLIERVGESPTLRAAQVAGRQATELLVSQLGLPPAALERLRIVEPLFESDEPKGRFTRWHALEFPPRAAPAVKVYLNPQIHGTESAASVTEEALRLLGLEREWNTTKAALHRGGLDELKYFSLDLASTGRVKVYLRHTGNATFEDIERCVSSCRGYEEGLVRNFCRTLCDGERSLDARPAFTCLGFEGDGTPPSATVYLPIAAYAPHDGVADDRIRRYLVRSGIPTDSYRRVMHKFTHRPLADGVGLISYVSVKARSGSPRVTVYLSPEAYHSRPPARIQGGRS